MDTVSNIDFTHSSKKAWKTVKRLTGAASLKVTACPIFPEDIGKVVLNGLTKYSRICLIRHIEGIRKKWRIRRSDQLCKQVQTLS